MIATSYLYINVGIIYKSVATYFRPVSCNPMTATPTRTRAAHLGPERRRPQVLNAALTIGVDDGLGAVTIGSVAKRMGVTRPVVYSCFPDRVALVDALLTREGDTLVESLLDALHSSGGADDPEQAFVRGFQSLLHQAEARPAPWRLLLFGDPDPAVAPQFRVARETIRTRATEWIAPAMRRWWQTADLDRKIPVLIDFFMSSCESAIKSLLASDGAWTADDLGDFLGRAVYRAFRNA